MVLKTIPINDQKTIGFYAEPVVHEFFADGSPNFKIANLHKMTGTHVVYLCDWSTPAARYYDMAALIPIAELGPATLKIVLPFMPTATMERESSAGSIATANVDAKLLSRLPGWKQVITVDLHTLQNQFYFHSCTTTLSSFMPFARGLLLFKVTKNAAVVAFPDDGAAKRFAQYFSDYDRVVCGKVRGDGDERTVRLTSGADPRGREVLIVDDLVRSGSTLIECAKVLKSAGATEIDVFVTHAVFPCGEWKRFVDSDHQYTCIRHFYTTDTVRQEEMEKHHQKFTVFPCSALIASILNGEQ